MNRKMVEYNIVFVNAGKSFSMPEWTVRKHEKLMESMIPYDEKVRDTKMTQTDYDKLYRIKMILLSLCEVDPKVTDKDLQTMHPDDFIDLWIAVYNSGKKGIVKKDSPDFQVGEKTPK